MNKLLISLLIILFLCFYIGEKAINIKDINIFSKSVELKTFSGYFSLKEKTKSILGEFSDLQDRFLKGLNKEKGFELNVAKIPANSKFIEAKKVDGLETEGTIENGLGDLLSVEAPDFDASTWMTDANPYIKDFKLKEIPMIGSHNALYYNEGAGGFCYVQYNDPDDQMSWGGARYFDMRPYVYQISSSVYGFGGFHGTICPVKQYDLTSKLTDMKTKLQGTSEIIILHIKEMKFGSGSEADLKTAFISMLNKVFGNMIISPAKAPNGPFGYTIDQLLTKGQVIIISEYSYTLPIYFIDSPREAENKGNYLWYPYVAETSSKTLATTFASSYLPSTATMTDKFLCVGASVKWSLNLKSAAVDWNEWFFKNKIDSWCKSNYNWIHMMDYVGWDQGWSRKIAKRLYQEGVVRGVGVKEAR